MVEQGVIRTPTYMVVLKVANRLDEHVEAPAIAEQEVLAEALRYENVQMNGHPADPWDEIPEHHRELWLKKAHRVQEALLTVSKRRA